MKKIMATMAVIIMVMALNVEAAFAASLGRYEYDQLASGKFVVVELNKNATLNEWTDPDFFGNQYRLYMRTVGDKEEVVCIKHHCSWEERRLINKATN